MRNIPKRVAASGLLSPDAGLVKIQSPVAGIVLERRVREGQRVQAGDVLYVVSSEVVFDANAGNAGGAGKGMAADLISFGLGLLAAIGYPFVAAWYLLAWYLLVS